jgi:hypothetical protein
MRELSSEIKVGKKRQTASPGYNIAHRLVVWPPSGPAQDADAKPATTVNSFAGLQRQITAEVENCEGSLQTQREAIAAVADQLPGIRRRIDWLDAGYYDRGRQSQAIAEQAAAQPGSSAPLQEKVRRLCDAQSRWNTTLDEMIDLLLGARSLSLTPAIHLKQR